MSLLNLPLEYYAYTSLLNCIVSSIVSVFVLRKQQEVKAARLFGYFMVLVAIWSWFYFLWLRVTADPELAGFLERTCMIPVTLMPPTFLHFAAALTGRLQRRTFHLANYSLGAAICLTVYTPLFSSGVGPHLVFPFWLIPGPIFPLHLLQMLSSVGLSLWLIGNTALKSTGQFRKQLWWVFYAYAIGFFCGFSNYLAWYRVPVPPVLNALVALHVVIIAYAVVRHKLWDMRVVIKTSLVYSSLIACITAAYLVAVLIVERYFQGFFGYSSFFATVFVAFLIAIFFNPLRNRIQAFVDRAFFKATPAEMAAQREQLLAEVRKGDQMKAVATLAAGLAHEIKNPLTAIKTFTEFLPEKHTDPEFIEKFHRIVGQEVDKIHRTVQDLLAFAKPESEKREPVALGEVVQDTLTLLSNDCLKRHVKTEIQVNPTLQIIGDRTKLKQALLNLCLNSLDAMESGGQLKVSVCSENSHAVLSVQDTGCGIPKDQLKKIFDPFFTTKASGTGLGLSVVQGIVRDHRGTIRFDSHTNVGTTCTLTFPLA